MAITAKEIAKQLNISEAAVSMALNNKTGVSTKRKNEIIAFAKQNGYDFSKINEKNITYGNIALINYRKHGAVVADTPFFEKLTEGIISACKLNKVVLHTIFVDDENILEQLKTIKYSYLGLLVLGTEIHEKELQLIANLNLPFVVIDTYFENLDMDYILINNIQGAYLATEYLIKKRKHQPGYLQSSYSILNFDERADGFYKAVRRNGMSPSKSIVHKLSPSFDGAYFDMLALIEQGDELANCYFADNDLIATGAMRALKEAGYNVPKDIAVVGFDNIPLSSQIEPQLTTINVPKQQMGQIAVAQLLEKIKNPTEVKTKTEIATGIVERQSV